MAWRLHLGSEPIPLGGSMPTMDVYVHPHMGNDRYFCGFGCLKKWVDPQVPAPRPVIPETADNPV